MNDCMDPFESAVRASGQAPRVRRVRGEVMRQGWLSGSWALVLLGLLAAGCQHARDEGRVSLQRPTALLEGVRSFLGGPLPGMLVDGDPFHARIVLTRSGGPEQRGQWSGVVQTREHRLMLSLGGEAEGGAPRTQRGGPLTFVWDTQSRTGWAFSEVLQGYAPVQPEALAAALTETTPAAGTGTTNMQGHLCRDFEGKASYADGSADTVRAWRMAEGGRPLQATVVRGDSSLRVELSAVQAGGAGLREFPRPDEYTAFATMEAMFDEMLLRGWRYRTPRRPPGDPVPEDFDHRELERRSRPRY